MTTVTLITGDGVGPEIAQAARRCIDATNPGIKWEVAEAGIDIMAKTGTPLPQATIESVRKNGIALKAPITTPVGTGFRSINVFLRQELELYACLRPCKSYKGVRSRYSDIDLVIVRENTEDLYAGIEFEKDKDDTAELINWLNKHGSTPPVGETSPSAGELAEVSKLACGRSLAAGGRKISVDSGISIKPISVKATEKIVRFAFEYARKYNRKKVTSVHKANIMKYTDGLWLETSRQVAKDYTDIEFEDRIVDNMCMQLIQKPELYDVLVLPNLYGDIISDLCAGLVGGLGVAPGANIGDEGAIFEATHGSAPKYAGQNKVNPCALILSGVLMLRHLGKVKEADKLEKAVADVIAEGKYVTYDMKPDRDDPTAVGTSEMADAIIKKIKNQK